MPYEPATPKAPIFLDDSQPQIKENFEEYQKTFATQHYDFGDALQGKHMHVGFITRDANTVPTTGANDCVLYSRRDTLTNNHLERDVLTFKRHANGEIYQFGEYRNHLFENAPPNNTDPYPGSAGWTLLPSGLLIKWQSLYTVNTTGGDLAFVFYRGTETVQFTSIYTAFVNILGRPDSVIDINVAAYVHNWTITDTAETINIKLWRRNRPQALIPSTPGTDQVPFRLNVLAFGKGPVT